MSKIAHSTVMDVLYYLTPQHCQEVVDSVVNTLNRVHARFRVRHPEFAGQVSVLGHSFGSVLLWDILCHQPSRGLPLPAENDARCSSSATGEVTEEQAQARENHRTGGSSQGGVEQGGYTQMERKAAASSLGGENAKERSESQQPTSTCTDTATEIHTPRPSASSEHDADTTSDTTVAAACSYPLPPTNAAAAAAAAAAVSYNHTAAAADSRRSADGERKESAAERENKFLRAEVARLHQELAGAEARLSTAEARCQAETAEALVTNTWQHNTIDYGQLAFEVDLFVLIGTRTAFFERCLLALVGTRLRSLLLTRDYFSATALPEPRERIRRLTHSKPHSILGRLLAARIQRPHSDVSTTMRGFICGQALPWACSCFCEATICWTASSRLSSPRRAA